MLVQEEVKIKPPQKTHLRPFSETIIVEFVGPPGAGKTTNCHSYTKMLKKKGLCVLTLQDIKDYLRNLYFPVKVLLLLKTALQLFPTLFSYARTLLAHRIFSISPIIRFLRISVFHAAMKQILRSREVDIVLLEQWMIQELWSATIFKPTSYQELEKKLQKYYLHTDQVVYFDIDLETASERISTRSSNLSRFDRMDANSRMKSLQQYTTYLYNLYTTSPCKNKYIISTRNHPDENAMLFIRHLKI